jgi:serine/threonine-protein kinase
MGEVYEGQDLTLGRKVALKRMLPDLKLDASLRKQFLHEAKTVAKLTHPYIVQIHDCMENGEDVYLVFEFVKGRTLAQVLTERPRLPLKECLRIFSHVCPAIEHAHKNHVLHRDLKPANIMIDDNGIARVMDFGIALESTRTVTSVGPGHLDASGTLRYMPPEQHYGKSVRASDVYAMGVCLYEMTTGTLPFAAGSVEELIEQKRARRFPAPSSLVPGLPRELDLFVTSVLAPDPQERMASAMEFLELLEGVAAA